MKFLEPLFLILFAAALTMVGCASNPTDSQIAAIKNACVLDAGVRPVITTLLVVPNLATVEEVGAVSAARAVIDPICANPNASPEANTLSILSANVGQIGALLVKLQTRQEAAK